MMSLGEWDIVTMTDVALVNAALIQRQNELITKFKHRESDFRLVGTFGPWQILPGGSMRMLNVEIPIVTGELRLLKHQGPTRLDGMTLKVRLSLRLLPIVDKPDLRELVFDFDGIDREEEGVLPIDYDDPDGRLDRIEASLFKIAVAKCLSAQATDVSFVFASVKARGTVKTTALEVPFHDWGNVVTTDGRQYLALAGALRKPKTDFANLDPQIIAQAGSAYVAMSNRMLMERAIFPTIQKDFRPKTPFALNGRTARSQCRIDLGKHKHGIWNVHPFVDRLSISQRDKDLHVAAISSADLPLGARLVSTLTLNMPFAYSPKTKQMTYKPDPAPKEHHDVHCPPVLDVFVGWLVRLIVHFNADAIKALVHACSSRLQNINTRIVDMNQWNGVRDFELGGAELNGCLVMRDSRPATS